MASYKEERVDFLPPGDGAKPAAAAGGSWITRKFPFLATKKGKVITVIVILVIISGGLAGLAALPKGGSGNGGVTETIVDGITSDSHFYGQSPPVYPAPEMPGTGPWADSLAKARSFVANMTLAEKVNITAGASSNTSCPGFVPAVPRLGFPGMCLGDAGNGLRATDFVSSWPSGIHVGASWNKELTQKRGSGMGGEFRTKGVNVLLGPVVGPAGRVVLSGRNWEGFSIDPYLAGQLVSETVTAVQAAGVITSTKHFIGNEQETHRNPSGDIESVSSNIDDQTLHELYLWPFQDAVRAGSGNMMCSYQRVNNSYGCANSKLLNGILKTELGFEGWVVTDWGAQHAGVATALAGLDMMMPGPDRFWGSNLETMIKNGSVPEARLNDMVTRIIATWYHFGQDKAFPRPGIGMPTDLTKAHQIVDARNISSRSTLFDGALEGHVLVKNIRNALPLEKPRMLSIFGYSAKNPDRNTPTGGLSAWTFGTESFNHSEFMGGFFGTADPGGSTPIAQYGTLYSGGGSGATSQGTVISPFDALVQRAYDDTTALFWDFTNGEPPVVPVSDACFVFGNAYATEGADRRGARDDYTDGLVLHVANRCNNTIVILHNAGIRLVDQFIDHPNVTALIFAHLPGEASGKAIVSLLYGDSYPSGKLPYTLAKNESDYPVLGPDRAQGQFLRFPQSNFTEGVFVDYRHFDAKNITPRYEFGFGLGYTTFNYSNLSVQKDSPDATKFAELPSGPIRVGGQTDLWDILVTVTADVRNVGQRDGAEVAQLYLGIPVEGQPVRQLRGFEKVVVNASATTTVKFELTRRDLSVWDVIRQKWRLPRGEYKVEVGGSSRDLPLVSRVVI
ncbi:glycosyl hydrolase family 3 N terminal domain-containing protein [Cercophora newfieldiana]|uniref:Beta-glucosidase cel3A n=1 Tax=Cercophora newfieldiana TaxID=92897 RepID=A0AA39YI04_9PEZI|nr:glycosyl hydrolase family 3 N terminal domain-containing protein [Cercophora newfieldiana]